jgi:hypothetical protein
MHDIFIQYVYLILIILALVMLANKLRVAYPIVLVLGGLALSLTAQFSNITISPELVFFIFLPPARLIKKGFSRFRTVSNILTPIISCAPQTIIFSAKPYQSRNDTARRLSGDARRLR